jgi:hypothetical protein
MTPCFRFGLKLVEWWAMKNQFTLFPQRSERLPQKTERVPDRVTTLKQPSLILCLLLDFIGYATYSIPILGEVADIIWAPISGMLFMAMFGGWRGAVGGVFNFIEELLPGTDFIPSFTLMWFLRKTQK